MKYRDIFKLKKDVMSFEHIFARLGTWFQRGIENRVILKDKFPNIG